MTILELDLEALAELNHGMIFTRDLKAMGVTEDEMPALRKHLHRVAWGAYALAPPADDVELHRLQVRAAVARHDHKVAASYVSGAIMHGLPSWGLNLERVHVTGLSGEVREGLRHGVHTHHGPLAGDELTRVDGLAVTTVPRTIVDCARRIPLEPAVVLADHALHRGSTTRAELERLRDELAAVRGIENVRRVVALVDERSESPGESRTRLTLVRGGIDVEPQVEITDARGGFVARADLLVKGSMVVVEFDGRMKYALQGDVAKAHWQEKQRHDRIQEMGYVVVRVTWQDLSQPRLVVERVRAAMARARPRPAA